MSLLDNEANAYLVFQSILKSISSIPKEKRFHEFERAWVLRSAFEKISSSTRKLKLMHSSEQIYFDSETPPDVRIEHLDSFLKRLHFDQRFLLLLNEKHKIPLEELATAMGAPVASLELMKHQAFQTLCDWVWENGKSEIGQIQERLRSSTLYSLPEHLLQSPLTRIPNVAPQRVDQRIRWQRTPWYVRTGVETIAIILTILFVVTTVPRVRGLYEKSLDRRIEAYQISEVSEKNEKNSNLPVPETDKSDPTAVQTEPFTQTQVRPTQTSADLATAKVKVDQGEIWRFIIKSDSPKDLKPKVLELLKRLNIPTELEGTTGIRVPGGIQFNLLVPMTAVPDLKNELQILAKSLMTDANDPAMKESFSWFKSKSKSPVPRDKTQVVVWLSQI